MEILANAWWTTGAFWQYVITTVVAVAVGALGAWATLRANHPKLKLSWWVRSNTSLLPEITDQVGGPGGPRLTVQLGNTVVSKPRLIELAVANTGRRDISAANFHQDQPIVFRLGGAQLLSIFGGTSEPAGTGDPIFGLIIANQTRERLFSIPPLLLRRGQVVIVRLLVDGDEKPVELLDAPLVDVSVANEVVR
ncbi:hypothetical protein [Streptomyces sp. PSAA01]|uniref:hypothetical protein n=1 Tax=Streptomyces sp. PSAA01 TaxID=2912762 RepID=UPI001F2AC6BB|nr:hypothetical protein [Streptomyces sp. PSAA01]MCG0289358.1 hypothetical protein [Streptomyces sp. PSAA01]